MTTATTEYNTQQKLKLIEEILNIILGGNIEFVKLESPQRVTFVKQWKENPAIFRVMVMAWNNELEFIVKEYRCREWIGVYVGSHRWFKVRDLIRKRFLDAEKLKVDAVEK